MSDTTKPEDLKHGDHVDIYEADGFLLYQGVVVTGVYIMGQDKLPLDFDPSKGNIVVEFWHPGKKRFVEIGTSGSPDSERTFIVTGHGWRRSPLISLPKEKISNIPRIIAADELREGQVVAAFVEEEDQDRLVVAAGRVTNVDHYELWSVNSSHEYALFTVSRAGRQDEIWSTSTFSQLVLLADND